MIANHPIKGHNYLYHIRGDRSRTHYTVDSMMGWRCNNEWGLDNCFKFVLVDYRLIKPYYIL